MILTKTSNNLIPSLIIDGNSNLQAKYCLFRNLQVSGNSKMETINIIEKGLFYGNAEFLDCNLNLNELILKHGKFTFKNSTIVGDIKIKKNGGEEEK